MVDQQLISYFNKIYDENYLNVMRYVIGKCSNPSDIPDIVQEIFTEAYMVIVKKGIHYIDNENAFIIRIAKTKVYRHYTLKEKLKYIIPLFSKDDDNKEVCIVDLEKDCHDLTIEDKIISNEAINEIWSVLKGKPLEVQRIFYLYYYCDITIREIASELNLGESNVKHKLYRTLNEIRLIYKKGGDVL